MKRELKIYIWKVTEDANSPREELINLQSHIL